MRTPFPKSPDTAGVTISTLPPEPYSRSRPALFSIAYAWSYRSRSGRTALTRYSAASPITMGCPWRNGVAVRSYPMPRPRSTISPSAPLRSMRTTIFRMRSAGFPHTWAPGWVPRSSRYPGCTSPPITRTRRAALRLTILPCRSTTAARTRTFPIRSWAGHLRAGADYGLNAKTLLGLKLTYSMMGDIEASGGYSLHPFHERDPDFPNHNTFTGARYWTLTLTVKRLFGN